MIKIVNTAFAFLICFSASAQMPSTDIFVVDLQLKDGTYTFGKPLNITNRPGYDNQPSFTDDGKNLLYSSVRDSGQTDIFMYTFKDSVTTRMTNTEESEYSPVMMPDNKWMSVVRVDKKGAQQLYYLDMSADHQDYPAAPNEDSVAYYGWIDKNNVAMTMLNGSQTQLYIYDVSINQYVILFPNTGRCLIKIPGTTEFSFTQKVTDSTYTIWRYNNATADMLPLCDLPVNCQDYAFTAEGKLFTGKDGKLLQYDSSTEKGDWKEVADFSKTVGPFFRIAINAKGTKMALAGLGYKEEKEKDKDKSQEDAEKTDKEKEKKP